nr:hypothetical protein CFP56_50545 [Quercus suber]
MKKLFGLKSKKKSKTDTQAKQLSAYEPENESQQAPQAEEAPQQQQQQQAPQTEEAPQQQQQQAPQTEEAPQQQQEAPPQTVTQAPPEPQPERINYKHYNQFISPYRMEDDLVMGAIEFQSQVTKWK